MVRALRIGLGSEAGILLVKPRVLMRGCLARACAGGS